MGRGSNLAEGHVIDEGWSASGVHTQIEFRGETVVFHRSQDMEAVLNHVQRMRERNEGKGWGEGREVGHIPDLFYAKIMQIQDFAERKRAVREFFQAHPAFCAYDPYLRRVVRAAKPAAPVAPLVPALPAWVADTALPLIGGA